MPEIRRADTPRAGAEETLDDLQLGGLQILQLKKGYRFSLDPVLLCGFARVGEGDLVADLGTGAGVIPLVLARSTGASRLLGIEVQPGLADRARRSVALNGLQERVEIVEADLRALPDALAAEGFDVVLSNPPFRRGGTGKLAAGAERAAARHELTGGLADFLGAAACLLRTGGKFYIVYLAERLAELLAAMRSAHLEPKRLRCVHSRAGEEAQLVLVEGRKGGREGMTIAAPLHVYAGEGYSEEVLALYRGEGEL